MDNDHESKRIIRDLLLRAIATSSGTLLSPLNKEPLGCYCLAIVSLGIRWTTLTVFSLESTAKSSS